MTSSTVHEAKLELLREHAAEQLKGACQACHLAFLSVGNDGEMASAMTRAVVLLEEATKAAAEIFKRKAAEAGEAGNGQSG
jgi:hypothetical protein